MGRLLTLRLPTAPSANKIWRAHTTKGSRTPHLAKSKQYGRWLEQAGWEAKIQAKGEAIVGRFGCRILLPRSVPGDIDNRAKATLDCLHGCGVTPDDALLDELSIARSSAITEGMLVSVYEMGANDEAP